MDAFHAQVKHALDQAGVPLLVVLMVLMLLDLRAHGWEHNPRTAMIAAAAMYILVIMFGRT